jgi:outer membrane usher protein
MPRAPAARAVAARTGSALAVAVFALALFAPTSPWCAPTGPHDGARRAVHARGTPLSQTDEVSLGTLETDAPDAELDTLASAYTTTGMTGGERALSLAIVVGTERYAGAGARIGAGQASLRIDSAALARALTTAVEVRIRESLQRSADDDGLVSLSALRASGLDARFEHDESALYIDVPAELRAVEVISLRSGAPDAAGATEVRPASLSGFVNGRVALDYADARGDLVPGHRQPARVELDGAINVHGLVLEAAGAYLEGDAHPWQRGEARLVADFPDAALRMEAGDLSFPTAGLQGRRPMAGIAVGTRFDLQPYRVIEPAGERELMIETPSRVEIHIDGHPIRTLRLLPGRYDLRDFQVSNGVHDVRIRIEDDLGRTREVSFGLSFEGGLLARGVHEVYGAVGLPRRVDPGDVRYMDDSPTYSGFLRYGLLDALTLGLHLQGDADRTVVGGELSVAGGYGTLRAVGALGADGARDDYALRLRYEYFDATRRNRWSRRFGLSVASHGTRFAALGAAANASASPLELSASVSQQVFSDATYASLDASRVVGRGTAGDETAVGLTLSHRLGPALELGVTIERRFGAAGAEAVRTLCHVSYSGGRVGGRQATSRTAYDTLERRSQLEWQIAAPDGAASGLSGGGRVVERPDAREIGVRGQYVGARGELELAHDATVATVPGVDDAWRTTVRAAGAIVFAGGHLALSRPVSNSFAIVVPDQSLGGAEIGVDRSGAHAVARTDVLGPAVVPNLAPYHVRALTIDAAGLPPGVALGESRFQAHPTHKSGLVIPVLPSTQAPAIHVLAASVEPSHR